MKAKHYVIISILLLVLVISPCKEIFSQTYTGKITDASTNLPVAYAAVYSKSLAIGVYSNEDGMFQIISKVPLENEDLIISCVGYQSVRYRITGPDCGRIKLKPVLYNLNEVRILGNDAEHKNFKYLDSLFQKYRHRSIRINSKAYFSFRAEEDSIPLEFQEMYYNAVTSCRNGLEEMTLKTGRIGNNEQNFLTVNVSDIFLSMKMFSVSGNISIPNSPANFRYKNMKKLFQFTTVGVSPGKDKYLMVLEPRSGKIPYFSVALYIDKTKNVIEKIEYSLKAGYFTYFYPLMPGDSVRNIDLKLVYYFDNQDDPFQIKQAGITYGINYYSSSTHRDHFIQGYGKLILFDLNQQYPEVIPPDLFKDQNNDYRLVSSLPYDSLFWEIPGIAPLSSKNLEYLDFFNIGKVSKTYNRKIQEVSLSRYMPWEKSQIVVYKDFDSVSRKKHKENLKIQDVYSIQKNSIKTRILLNYFFMGDSLHLSSSTLIDLVDSYFEPDTGFKMIAFINLNFDLAEAFRHKMVDQIYLNPKFQRPESEPELKKMYQRLNQQLADTLVLLKKQTQNGTNLEMLTTWLKYMKSHYQIDRNEMIKLLVIEDRFLKGRKLTKILVIDDSKKGKSRNKK